MSSYGDTASVINAEAENQASGADDRVKDNEDQIVCKKFRDADEVELPRYLRKMNLMELSSYLPPNLNGRAEMPNKVSTSDTHEGCGGVCVCKCLISYLLVLVFQSNPFFCLGEL